MRPGRRDRVRPDRPQREGPSRPSRTSRRRRRPPRSSSPQRSLRSGRPPSGTPRRRHPRPPCRGRHSRLSSERSLVVRRTSRGNPQREFLRRGGSHLRCGCGRSTIPCGTLHRGRGRDRAEFLRARCVRGDPVDERLKLGVNRVESLRKALHEGHAGGGDGGLDRVEPGEVDGDRLLAQDRLSPSARTLDQGRMPGGLGGDGDGVNPVEKAFQVGFERAAVTLRGGFPRFTSSSQIPARSAAGSRRKASDQNTAWSWAKLSTPTRMRVIASSEHWRIAISVPTRAYNSATARNDCPPGLRAITR